MDSTTSKGKKHQDTSQYGQVYLQTDKTAYQAGETVTGTISINLISPYPGNQLFLKLKGVEAVHFLKPVKKREVYAKFKSTGKHEIMKETVLVHSWEVFSPGQYSLPFSFLLPQDIPTSFYQQGHKYFASIQYKLEAFIRPQNESNPKMKCRQPLILRENVEPLISGELSQEVKTNLEGCCGSQQGSAMLKVNFEKKSYSPGETAKVLMEFDTTNSNQKNLKVVLALKQSVQLKAEARYFGRELVKVTKELPGIGKGSKMSPESLSIVLPHFYNETDFKRTLDKQEITQSILEGLKEKNNAITSSTIGKFVYSEYFLEVSCPMSGCCATNPRAKCAISITCPDLEPSIVFLPSEWNPKMERPVNLAFACSRKAQTQALPKNQKEMVSAQMMPKINLAQKKVEMGSTHYLQADQASGEEAKVNQINSGTQ